MLFLSCSLYAVAQLNIIPKNDGLKEYTVQNAQPYDSLANVDNRSFASLPGQTLYMHGAKNDSRGYYEVFFTDRKSTRLNSSHMPKSRMPSSA